MRLLFFCFVLCVFIFLFKKKLVNLWCILDNITGRFFSKWIGFLGWESNQEVVLGLVIGNVFLQKKKKIWIIKIILFSSDVKKPRWHIIHFTTYRSTMRFMLQMICSFLLYILSFFGIRKPTQYVDFFRFFISPYNFIFPSF